MSDMAALEAKIEASGLKRAFVAEQLGVSGQTLRSKLQGAFEFKASEIKTLTDLLRLTKTEMEHIFFG